MGFFFPPITQRKQSMIVLLRDVNKWRKSIACWQIYEKLSLSTPWTQLGTAEIVPGTKFSFFRVGYRRFCSCIFISRECIHLAVIGTWHIPPKLFLWAQWTAFIGKVRSGQPGSSILPAVSKSHHGSKNEINELKETTLKPEMEWKFN